MSEPAYRISVPAGFLEGFPMTQSAQLVLSTVIEQLRDENYPHLSADAYFEIFASQQALKRLRFNLDAVEIESGIVGGEGDGGVDGFYCFVNRKFVREDTDPQEFKGQQISIDLVIVQSKNTNGFGESVPTKLKDFVEFCLQLGAVLTPEVKLLYRPELLTLVKKFHDIYRSSLLHRPTLAIHFFHVALGEQVDEKVRGRAKLLTDKTKATFTTAECNYFPVTGSELLMLHHQRPESRLALKTRNYFDLQSFGRNAYVCVSNLTDFYEFIADNGELREHLFDANVRDHAPEVRVNKGIRASLELPENDDFWWLNNGVTILASHVLHEDGALQITDPMIVNGLQTSYVIYSHFKDGGSTADTRTLMVKVIANTDSGTSDRIINATNSQTKIESINLHATEPIHRNIETALGVVNLYYDRRKNFYRNKGQPATKIITIGYLAQAVASIVLQQPDNARARPTTIADKNYSSLFSDKYSLEMYQKCALLMKRVQAFLDKKELAQGHKLNLGFYLSMYAAASAFRSPRPRAATIAKMDMEDIGDALLEKCYQWLSSEFQRLGGDDKTAKGPELLANLKTKLIDEYGRKKQQS